MLGETTALLTVWKCKEGMEVKKYFVMVRTKEGIEFMEHTRPKWIDCGFFSSHMSWHHCLFLMELEKYDQVLQIYDKEIKDNFITHTLVFKFRIVEPNFH